MLAVVANDECLKLQVQEPTWTPPTLDMKEITLKSQSLQSDDQIVVSSLQDLHLHVAHALGVIHIYTCQLTPDLLTLRSLCVYILSMHYYYRHKYFALV